jgi:hypothetical protein
MATNNNNITTAAAAVDGVENRFNDIVTLRLS